MRFLIVAVVVVAVCQALPQQKLQQQKTLFEASDQGYRQPINLAEFIQPQQQLFYKQQDFKSEDNSQNTAWIPIIKSTGELETDRRNKRHRRTSYETGNNIIAEESGYLQSNAENENPSLVQQGSYTYIAPDGETISVQYTADQFGFRATGDHIPTPPPVSAEIQKGLDLIYAGIKANAEKRAQEQKEHPEEYAMKQADRAALDFSGQYYQQ